MEWSIKGCNKLETVTGRHKCTCLRHLQGFVVLPESLLSNSAKNFIEVVYIINTPEVHDKMFIWDDLWWKWISVPHCLLPPGHHEDLAWFLLCGYDITCWHSVKRWIHTAHLDKEKHPDFFVFYTMGAMNSASQCLKKIQCKVINKRRKI